MSSRIKKIECILQGLTILEALTLSMELFNGMPAFHAKNRKAWRKWLEKNHTKEKKVWLIIYRKNTGVHSVYYEDAVEEALCFGWIDSKANKRDDESFFQSFSVRKPTSNWSGINKKRVAKLVASGLMTPAGMAVIEMAKENGRWTALDEVENAVIPEDLEKALKDNKMALGHFTAFPSSVKRGILQWIQSAKRPETRKLRIENTVKLAGKNIRANQYRKPE